MSLGKSLKKFIGKGLSYCFSCDAPFYKGKIVDKTRIGKFNAIVPEITGKAWIHGFSTIIIDRTDPFKYGFRLREKIMKPIDIDPYSWIIDDGEEDG